jgi:hypothetical protein
MRRLTTTAIAGIAKEGTVWIGGDSAGIDVTNLALTVRADEKVFINQNFIFGFTSSFRMGQLLRYSFSPPGQVQGQDLNEYMVTTFIDAVRDCLKEGGFQEKENEVESGGTFLVGHQGHLFTVDSDYQVGESLDGYDAVGCGGQSQRVRSFRPRISLTKSIVSSWLSRPQSITAAASVDHSIS